MFKANIQNIYSSPFAAALLRRDKEKGKQWLDDLPNLIAQLAATYGLSNLKSVEALSYNYVLTGLQGSKAVILKLGLDIDGFKREAAALNLPIGLGATIS
jgi:streptomycin 6-kinase